MNVIRADGEKTVAIVTSRLPYPGPEGNLRYMYAFVQFLEARGHRVHFVLRTPKVPFIFSTLQQFFPSGNVRVEAPGIFHLGRWHMVFHPSRAAKNLASNLLLVFPAPFVAAARRILLRLLQGPTHGIDAETNAPVFLDTSQHDPDPGEVAFVTSIFDRINPDAVFFDTSFCAPYCGHLGNTAVKYVITHDVIHERHQTFVDQGYQIRPRWITREEEASLLGAFDVIIAIQPEEAESFTALRPDRQVVAIPFPLATTTHNPSDEIAGRCLFAGSVGLHNVDGLRWFLHQVWPAVVAQVPTAMLHVCGAVCEEVRDPCPSVLYRGVVPDLSAEYAAAALVIVPLRAGSGLKIKVVEALSHGCPCVTTEIGAQGLPRGDHAPFVVADEAGAFAEAVIDLLRDDTARHLMGGAAHEFCEPYTADRAFAPLIERGL